jgi:hypothetical protein
MILEGLLDEETGEYIGDRNRSLYGEEAPGFPVSYNRKPTRVPCPHCGKRIAAGEHSMQMHIKAKHKNA